MTDKVKEWRKMVDGCSRYDYDIGHYWNALEDACELIQSLEAENASLMANLSNGIGKQPLRGLVFRKLKERVEELKLELTRCQQDSNKP